MSDDAKQGLADAVLTAAAAKVIELGSKELLRRLRVAREALKAIAESARGEAQALAAQALQDMGGKED